MTSPSHPERDGAQELIDELTRDLPPVKPPPGLGASSLVWLGLAWAIALVATWWIAPFRPGVGDQFLGSARFAFESVTGWAIGVFAIGAALHAGTPGGRPASKLALAVLGVAGLWFGLYAIGLVWPTFPASMEGKRSLCDMEALMHSALPLLIGFLVMRRRVVLDPRWTGLLLGIAAGSVPALIMNWACMYDAAHILQHHLVPMLIVAAAGWFLGPRVLPTV